eukprot:gene20898-22949_t
MKNPKPHYQHLQKVFVIDGDGVPETSELFEPLDKAISAKLIPAILGRDISDIERKLNALPLRMGGLGIRDPQETADREFQSSVAITKN